jgi:hypothetical protein
MTALPSNLDPDVACHLKGEGRHRFRELLDHLLNRLAEVCADFVQTLDDEALIDRVETGESSVKSGFLRLAGQLVESLAPIPVAALLEGDQVIFYCQVGR